MSLGLNGYIIEFRKSQGNNYNSCKFSKFLKDMSHSLQVYEVSIIAIRKLDKGNKRWGASVYEAADKRCHLYHIVRGVVIVMENSMDVLYQMKTNHQSYNPGDTDATGYKCKENEIIFVKEMPICSCLI